MKKFAIVLSVIVALICIQVVKNTVENKNLRVEYGATIDQLTEAVAQLDAERETDPSKITVVKNPFVADQDKVVKQIQAERREDSKEWQK